VTAVLCPSPYPQSVPQITSVTFAAIEVYEPVAGGPTSLEAPGQLIGPVA
jgi:hypothetical protein